MSRIAIVGSGLIGVGWAIVFARAGHEVALWDGAEGATTRALAAVDRQLADMAAAGIMADPAATRARIGTAATLAAAFEGAVYAQESIAEAEEAKRAIFHAMDAVAPPEAVLGSSTSYIRGSRFLGEVPGRHRCLIAHPANPPHLLPVVELVPSPWTDPAATEAARALMEAAGQTPAIVRREVDGFVMNRMQAALINEAMALVGDGVVAPEDLDRIVRDSLGLRWSFMGPFETMDLNAPDGFRDYAARYGATMQALGRELGVTKPWTTEAVDTIDGARRRQVPAGEVKARQDWRDRRLMALLAHRQAAAARFGR